MTGIKTMSTILFLAVILSIYTLIFRYRTRDKVIVKTKLINRRLLNSKFVMILLAMCSIICICLIMMLLYGSIEEFHSTKSFRDEYEIKFSELINDNKIEKLVIKLDGNNKEWGKWALKQIRQSKILFGYVVNMIIFIALFFNIAKIRIESNGIRKFIFLTPWEDYKGYFWRDDEVSILACKSKQDIKVRIDCKEKNILDNFLNKETKLIEKN